MSDELLHKARSCDGTAFSALAEPLRPRLLAYLYRRLADRGAAEDLCQEALLEAYTSLSEMEPPTTFKDWLFRFASRFADRAAEGAQPWGESSLEVLQDYLLEHEATQNELQETLESREEEYSLADHVDFCFTVTLQSLFPRERNVFLLTQMEGFTAREAADVMGGSPEEIEEKSAAAAESLQEIYAERCSLVKAGAPCKQCRVFGEWLLGPKETEEELRGLPLQPSVKPEATFPKRLQLVSRLDPLHNGSDRFHEQLLQLLRRALGEKGLLKP
ncbi:MAG: RNA polymerase sigma factor [Deltaproteobacteria bacterium]|nr:RNA polymerase sigma factor [Deltaproteobacteria bacterium]